MTQSCKHEDLNLVPRTHVKNLHVVACDYGSSTGEADTGASLVELVSLRLVRNPVTKK